MPPHIGNQTISSLHDNDYITLNTHYRMAKNEPYKQLPLVRDILLY